MPLTQIAEFKAHPRHAQGVAFSPDGGELVTTGMDEVARVWSASDFGLSRTLEAHEKSVNAIAISPDGEIAVTASSDRTAIVWDYQSARALQTLTGFRNTLAAAKFSIYIGVLQSPIDLRLVALAENAQLIGTSICTINSALEDNLAQIIPSSYTC